MLNFLKGHLNRIIFKYDALLWAKLLLLFHIRLRSRLKKQVKFAQERSRPVSKPGRKVLLIQNETQHYQMYQMFILCKALQIRGCDIRILICDSFLDGCEIKNARKAKDKDPCFYCRFHRKHVVPLFGLPVINLSDQIAHSDLEHFRALADTISADYPASYEYRGIDIIPMTNDSVTRYFFGDVPSDESVLRKVRKDHLTSSMIGIEAARKIDAEYGPDIVLNNMYVYSVAEPYYRYFKNRGVQTTTISITPVDYHGVMIDMMELYKNSDRFEAYLNFRNNAKLGKTEREALLNLMKLRHSGQITMFREFGYFGNDEDPKEILSIDPQKRNVFLFSNVLWDLGELGILFPDIADWVLRTIEMVLGRKDIHLYIKPHPGEVYDSHSSLKGIADHIAEKYPVLPENLTIIKPELKIRPYDLFQYIDLGVVYYGTLGLEMLLKDIPVLIAARPPYAGLGLAHEPDSLEAYRQIVLGEAPPVRPDKDLIELFAYFYFIKTSIPWNLTKRAYDDSRFDGFTFSSLDDILPGRNEYLDHICRCILDRDRTVIEGWQ